MKPNDQLCALANSLPATIRWRFCDYEELLKKELQMLAAPPQRVWAPRDANGSQARAVS